MKISKTIVINALVVLAGFGTYLIDGDLLKQYPDVVALIATSVGVLNIVLRYLTKVPMIGFLFKADK